MAAEPMFRATRPEMMSDSNLASCEGAASAKIIVMRNTIITAARQRIMLRISANSSARKLKQRLLGENTSRDIRAPEKSFPGRRRFCLRFGDGHREMCVFQLDILLHLFARDLPA